MKKRIVIVTDCADVASNELRGAIISNLKTKNEVIIEPTVTVLPFSIINGNFVLRLMAESYPEGTIFSVVLNPMRNRPERLIGRTKKNGYLFMGANTGVFDWFLRDYGVEELYELKDPGFFPFGGKYVHSPVIAKIASGEPLNSLGKKFDEEKLLKLEISEGTIVHIDNFGLMKFTGILPEVNLGEKFVVSVNDKTINAIYARRMMSEETGTWVLYPGSSLGLPELGKVRENGANELGAKVGDKVIFTLEKVSPTV